MQLEVGAATQTMTVTGEAVALLQTTESSVGFVVQSQQVTELPLNGRYFTQLLQLSPGATSIGFQSALAAAASTSCGRLFHSR